MTQKKDNRLPILDEKARCVCGAETYDPEKRPHGAVGLIRYRKSKYGNDGGYSVGCTRCGRWVRVDGHRLTHWHIGWGRRSNMAR